MSRQRLLSFLGAAACVASVGCVSPGEGPTPPGGDLYYPVAAAISPAGHTMYVANSDFDLQYNAGTVVALDLDRIRKIVQGMWDPANPDPCTGIGDNPQKLLYPGRCAAIDLASAPDHRGSLIVASTQIGAFATNLLVLKRQGGPGARLFIPVRGDPSITWLDLDDDRYATGTDFPRQLYCGQTAGSPRCDAAHRAGQDPKANLRGAVLPPEPFDLASTEDGSAIVVSHQTTGAMSLLTNEWDGVPTLQFVAGGFPYGAVGVVAVPPPKYAWRVGLNYQPGFLATFRAAAEVDLIRYYDDTAAAPSHPFITRAGAAPITVNAGGWDSRGIALDPTERKSCEATCGDQHCSDQCSTISDPADRDTCERDCWDDTCLQDCAKVPLAVYIANRSPPSLLVGETRTNVGPTGSDDQVSIYDSIPLSYGASRVLVGSVIGRDGNPQTRVFVSCFDSRYVFIYDPVGRRVDGQISTGRGPQGLVQDPLAPYLYVVHFTDSYVGAVDLDMRNADTYATIVATIGVPKPPRESK